MHHNTNTVPAPSRSYFSIPSSLPELRAIMLLLELITAVIITAAHHCRPPCIRSAFWTEYQHLIASLLLADSITRAASVASPLNIRVACAACTVTQPSCTRCLHTEPPELHPRLAHTITRAGLHTHPPELHSLLAPSPLSPSTTTATHCRV